MNIKRITFRLVVMGKIIFAITTIPITLTLALLNARVFKSKGFLSAGTIANNHLVNQPMQAGGNQPPDLDEVFNEWKKKLDGFFRDLSKGKGSDNKNSNNSGGDKNFNMPNMNIAKSFLGLIGVLVFTVLWLVSGFYTVDADERGVVMQFGKYIKTTEPGWNWRLPYPFQSHDIVLFTRVRTFEITGNTKQTGAQMLTSDENVIQVQFSVQYDVIDPYSYVFVDVNPEETTRLVAETAMREVVGNSTMDRVLSENREEVARSVKDIMQSILDRYQVGVRVQRINLQSVNPPNKVQDAFDDVIKARQDQDRQINEGQAYQQDVVPRARGTASRLLEEANAYKQEVVARAEGEASRFIQLYDEYKNAKQVTRERIYLDNIGEIIGSSKKIIVDPNIKGIINFGGQYGKDNNILPFYEENKMPTTSQQTTPIIKSNSASEIEKRRAK